MGATEAWNRVRTAGFFYDADVGVTAT